MAWVHLCRGSRERRARYSIDSLYWYKNTNNDAEDADSVRVLRPGFVIFYQYARFTGTKVQILTQNTLLARVPPVVLFKSHDAQVLGLLALLVQKVQILTATPAYDAQAAVSEAAQNTRATHDVLASVA